MNDSFDNKWNKIYGDGKQINEFPFSDLISFFYNKFKENSSKLNILEVGCGAGNNLEFIAKLGHNVFGIDASEKIIEYRIGNQFNKLALMTLHQFSDELSSDSPAPGGGSVAALAGALGA